SDVPDKGDRQVFRPFLQELPHIPFPRNDNVYMPPVLADFPYRFYEQVRPFLVDNPADKQDERCVGMHSIRSLHFPRIYRCPELAGNHAVWNYIALPVRYII